MRSIETDSLCERPEVDTDEFTGAIEREVERAACGQIGALSVSRLGAVYVLRGHCRTYHASQLARQAALDLIEDPALLVDLILVQ